jgi:hypothetical protein
VKIDGTPVEVNSREYISLLKELERDDIASVDTTSAPQSARYSTTSAPEAVQEITAVAREPASEVDTYRPNGAGLLLDCPKAPVLMKRQAPFYTEENK